VRGERNSNAIYRGRFKPFNEITEGGGECGLNQPASSEKKGDSSAAGLLVETGGRIRKREGVNPVIKKKTGNVGGEHRQGGDHAGRMTTTDRVNETQP